LPLHPSHLGQVHCRRRLFADDRGVVRRVACLVARHQQTVGGGKRSAGAARHCPPSDQLVTTCKERKPNATGRRHKIHTEPRGGCVHRVVWRTPWCRSCGILLRYEPRDSAELRAVIGIPRSTLHSDYCSVTSLPRRCEEDDDYIRYEIQSRGEIRNVKCRRHRLTDRRAVSVSGLGSPPILAVESTCRAAVAIPVTRGSSLRPNYGSETQTKGERPFVASCWRMRFQLIPLVAITTTTTTYNIWTD